MCFLNYFSQGNFHQSSFHYLLFTSFEFNKNILFMPFYPPLSVFQFYQGLFKYYLITFWAAHQLWYGMVQDHKSGSSRPGGRVCGEAGYLGKAIVKTGTIYLYQFNFFNYYSFNWIAYEALSGWRFRRRRKNGLEFYLEEMLLQMFSNAGHRLFIVLSDRKSRIQETLNLSTDADIMIFTIRLFFIFVFSRG